MYHKRYGLIETLAPLHIGASAGEESGNLNLIFRDQFTQTGIIPGSSIRGRFRADMRSRRQDWLIDELQQAKITIPPDPSLKWLEQTWLEYTLKNKLIEQGVEIPAQASLDWLREQWLRRTLDKQKVTIPTDASLNWLDSKVRSLGLRIAVDVAIDEGYWYGYEAVAGQADGGTTEAKAKFEYASLVWLPVFCPGQPVVWISCPRLLKRYKLITGIEAKLPSPYSADPGLRGRPMPDSNGKLLFFNLGFLKIEHQVDLSPWIPPETDLVKESLVVVGDNDIAMLHDMALYRQSRVSLGTEENPNEKKAKGGAFFNVEALPEGSILVFPVALKQPNWQPFGHQASEDLYFGGLESIGFGHCRVTLAGDY